MLSLKPTRARLRQHFQYAAKFYILLPLAVLVGLSFAYTATRPKTPPNQKLDIILVGYGNEDGIARMEAEILSILPQDQLEVNIITTANTGSGAYDYNIAQMLWIQTAVGEGDIFIFNAENYYATLMLSLVDMTPYIDQGLFAFPQGVDPAMYKFEGDPNEDSALNQLPHGIYALPLDGLAGLAEITLVNNVEEESGLTTPIPLAVGITGYSQNFDNALKALQWLYENKTLYDAGKAGFE